MIEGAGNTGSIISSESISVYKKYQLVDTAASTVNYMCI